MSKTENGRTCEHDGCTDDGFECRLLATNDVPDEILCPKHAADAGYCPTCGTFWAGVDDWAFQLFRGICENCRVEFEQIDDCDDDAWSPDLP